MKRTDGFLDRWSRRKLQKAVQEENLPEAQPAESLEASPGPDAGKTDEEILKELGLPDPDKLKPGDDFSGFMEKAVPRRLRNRALRKLWLTDPVLANLDELVDYGDDFTDAATVVENLQTAYRVGKGMLTSEEEDDQAEKTTEASKDEARGDVQDSAPPEDPSPPVAPSTPEAVADQGEGCAPIPTASEMDAHPMRASRRMRFTFDDT